MLGNQFVKPITESFYRGGILTIDAFVKLPRATGVVSLNVAFKTEQTTGIFKHNLEISPSEVATRSNVKEGTIGDFVIFNIYLNQPIKFGFWLIANRGTPIFGNRLSCERRVESISIPIARNLFPIFSFHVIGMDQLSTVSSSQA